MSLMNWLSKTIWNHGMVTSEGLGRSSIPLYPLEAQLFSLSFWHSDCGCFCCIQHLRHSLHEVLGIVRQHFTRLLVSLWVWMKNEEFEGDTEIPNPNSIEENFCKVQIGTFLMIECQHAKMPRSQVNNMHWMPNTLCFMAVHKRSTNGSLILYCFRTEVQTK